MDWLLFTSDGAEEKIMLIEPGVLMLESQIKDHPPRAGGAGAGCVGGWVRVASTPCPSKGQSFPILIYFGTPHIG